MDRAELRAYLMKKKAVEMPAAAKNPGEVGIVVGSVLQMAEFINIPGENFKITQHARCVPIAEHGHDYYEMMYVYDGSVTQNIEGERIVLSKGSVCIMDTKVKHSTEICGETDIAVNFILHKEFISPGFLSRIRENSLFSEFFINAMYKPESFGRYLAVHAGRNALVQEYAASIMCEYYDPGICSEGIIECLMPLLFNELFREWRTQGGKKNLIEPDGSNTLWRILRYIQTNYTNATLASTAHRFGYSPSYLSTLLVRSTGLNFTEIRHQVCMEQASFLLQNSDLPISEISKSVGLTNVTFFYSLFYRNFGISPAEYRVKAKSGMQ